MCPVKLSRKEKNWETNFNKSITGNRNALYQIAPDAEVFKVVIKEIYKERKRFRYDVASQGIRTFIADHDYELVTQDQTQQWPTTRGQYTPGDYQVKVLGSFEDALIEAIDNHQFEAPKFRLVREPHVGNKVKVWIADHYYDGQKGVILARRPNGQYLVQLTERAAPARGYSDPGVAQLWLKADDLVIL